MVSYNYTSVGEIPNVRIILDCGRIHYPSKDKIVFEQDNYLVARTSKQDTPTGVQYRLYFYYVLSKSVSPYYFNGICLGGVTYTIKERKQYYDSLTLDNIRAAFATYINPTVYYYVNNKNEVEKKVVPKCWGEQKLLDSKPFSRQYYTDLNELLRDYKQKIMSENAKFKELIARNENTLVQISNSVNNLK